MPRFLDENGLKLLWSRITEFILNRFENITSNIVTVGEKIPVAGGPLATDEVMAKFPDGIDKNVDLQQLISVLFCEEKYPIATYKDGTLQSAFSKPNLQVPYSGSSDYVEVGTNITIPIFNGYDPTPTSSGRTFTGFTYGYATEVGGDITKSNPSTVNVTGITLNTGTFRLTRTYTGFTNTTNVKTAEGSSKSINIPSDSTPRVSEGNNTVNFKIEGPGHRGIVTQTPIYYIVSNLGNTSDEHLVGARPQQNLSLSSATSSNTTYTVKGRYYYYMGYTPATTLKEINSELIKSLEMKGWTNPDADTTIVGEEEHISDGHSIIIACPPGYSLKNIENGLGLDLDEDFTVTGTIGVTTGAITSNYNIFLLPITNGVTIEYKNVKIGK